MPHASPPSPHSVQPATLRTREMLAMLNTSKSKFYRDLALGSSRRGSGSGRRGGG